MIIIFTKNDSFWAKALMYFCNEPVSHVAALLPGVSNQIFHASNHGFEIVCPTKFFPKNKIIAAIEISSAVKGDIEFDRSLMRSIYPFMGRPYDWPAYIYFGIRLILRKYTRLPLPVRNPFSTDRGFLCCEIFAPMSKVLLQHSSLHIDIDLAITTPWGLFKYLTDRKLKNVQEINSDRIKKNIPSNV